MPDNLTFLVEEKKKKAFEQTLSDINFFDK